MLHFEGARQVSRQSANTKRQTDGCVAWRGVAWRGVAWRGVAWRVMSCHVMSCHVMSCVLLVSQTTANIAAQSAAQTSLSANWRVMNRSNSAGPNNKANGRASSR